MLLSPAGFRTVWDAMPLTSAAKAQSDTVVSADEKWNFNRGDHSHTCRSHAVTNLLNHTQTYRDKTYTCSYSEGLHVYTQIFCSSDSCCASASTDENFWATTFDIIDE